MTVLFHLSNNTKIETRLLDNHKGGWVSLKTTEDDLTMFLIKVEYIDKLIDSLNKLKEMALERKEISK